MADDKNKPKVGVYGDDASTATVEPTTNEKTETTSATKDEKGGGFPTWAIGLIILAVLVLIVILFF